MGKSFGRLSTWGQADHLRRELYCTPRNRSGQLTEIELYLFSFLGLYFRCGGDTLNNFFREMGVWPMSKSELLLGDILSVLRSHNLTKIEGIWRSKGNDLPWVGEYKGPRCTSILSEWVFD